MSAASFVDERPTRARVAPRLHRPDTESTSGIWARASVAARVAGLVPVQSEFYGHRFRSFGLEQVSVTRSVQLVGN